MTEAKLWKKIKDKLPPTPDRDWQRIESGLTLRGMPDTNLCSRGVESWIELKVIRGAKLSIRPTQIVWHERRARAGGRSFVIGANDVTLMVWQGTDIRRLAHEGARVPALFVGELKTLNWARVEQILTEAPHVATAQ